MSQVSVNPAVDPLDATVTGPELAALLGLSTRRIAQLADAGIIPRASRGTFRLQAAVQGYLRHLVARPARTETRGSRQLREARARQIERRVEREAENEIPVVEARAVLDDVVGIYNREFSVMAATAPVTPTVRYALQVQVAATERRVDQTLEHRMSSLTTPRSRRGRS